MNNLPLLISIILVPLITVFFGVSIRKICGMRPLPNSDLILLLISSDLALLASDSALKKVASHTLPIAITKFLLIIFLLMSIAAFFHGLIYVEKEISNYNLATNCNELLPLGQKMDIPNYPAKHLMISWIVVPTLLLLHSYLIIGFKW